MYICHSLVPVACFDKPSCYDQGPQTFSDQHGIGDTLFTFTYPAPSRHFPYFRSNWRQLQWTLEDSDLDVASVDYYGGKICTIFIGYDSFNLHIFSNVCFRVLRKKKIVFILTGPKSWVCISGTTVNRVNLNVPS